MSVTITGATGLQRKLKKVEKAISVSPKRLIKTVGEARNRIRKRTNKGHTAAGGSFKALNSSYAEFKTAKGKSGKPNLHWSGGMLNAMTVKSIKNGAMIYFNDETERKKAKWHHFGVAPHTIKAKKKKVLSNGMHFFGKEVTVSLPRRSFFRLGKKIEKYIFTEFRKPIKKAL